MSEISYSVGGRTVVETWVVQDGILTITRKWADTGEVTYQESFVAPDGPSVPTPPELKEPA